jgi:TetR/AcrR family transcriptional regulator
MVHDPKRTRARILAAAEKEFSAKGFAGARVDAIAKRAGINKRMLYHYFGNKEGLFREILLRGLTQPGSPFGAPEPAPTGLFDYLRYFHEACARNHDFLRLLEWEALSQSRRVIGEDERRAEEVNGVERIRRAQNQGLVPSDLEPEQFLLAMMGLVTFPFAFPQVTRLVTGLSPSDLEFRRHRLEFLQKLAGLFEPVTGNATANISTAST